MFGLFQPTPPASHNLTATQFAEGVGRPGAVNIEVTAADFAQRVAALDKTKPAYVYCRSGAHSANAAAQLSAAGFTQLHNLLGGVLDWPAPLIR